MSVPLSVETLTSRTHRDEIQVSKENVEGILASYSSIKDDREPECNSSYHSSLYDGDKHLMVGQVYYSLKEMILGKVFEDVPNPHVYEFDEMREVFKAEICGEKGAIFKLSHGQKSKAQDEWETIVKNIDWDEKVYNYIKDFRYGYAERRLGAKELKQFLKYADESECFFKKDIEMLNRCITMLEKVEKMI